MSGFSMPCPCCSTLQYDVCCQPFHQGMVPQNALLLMRSRYVAYALDIPLYIIETTHPKNPNYETNRLAWIQSIQAFSHKTTFNRLDILDFQENGDQATVTFMAHLTQENRNATFTEKSTFVKDEGHWWYRFGHILS